MNLSVEVRYVNHIVIMELAGRLSVFESRPKQVASELIQRGKRFFIINLANVSYLDNSGLGQLCWIYTVAKNRGGGMKVFNPNPRTRQILKISKLDSIFGCFDREEDAIASMPPQMNPFSMTASG